MKNIGQKPLTPAEVRHQLIDAVRLDLIGPGETLDTKNACTPQYQTEILSQRPSAWYLTGFLVPVDAEPQQKADEQSVDELDEVSDSKGTDDANSPEPASAQIRYLPSSIGLSVLLEPTTSSIAATVRWGEYALVAKQANEDNAELKTSIWQRTQREEKVEIDIPRVTEEPITIVIPNSGGLLLVTSVKLCTSSAFEDVLLDGSKSVSVFLVNNRRPSLDEIRDQAFVFQAQLELNSTTSFVPRPDLHCLQSNEWDERVADLQYRDVFEHAVGHGVAVDAVLEENGDCNIVRTCWLPSAEVERVAPTSLETINLLMDDLSKLQDGNDVIAKLGSFDLQYLKWIGEQKKILEMIGLPRDCRQQMIF